MKVDGRLSRGSGSGSSGSSSGSSCMESGCGSGGGGGWGSLSAAVAVNTGGGVGGTERVGGACHLAWGARGGGRQVTSPPGIPSRTCDCYCSIS